jgi:hypothetical protein
MAAVVGVVAVTAAVVEAVDVVGAAVDEMDAVDRAAVVVVEGTRTFATDFRGFSLINLTTRIEGHGFRCGLLCWRIYV